MRYQSLVNRNSLVIAAFAVISTISIVSAFELSDSTVHVEPTKLSAAAIQEVDQLEWWKKTNFYHIYVRSFKDTTGNGQGDLRGIIEQLDYLKMIGVETLLMSPFYKSPMKDAGYDISDYEDINELFGNMADFEELVQKIHARSMKLVIDFVPNHSSNKHKWFQYSERALAEPEKYGKYKDYYMWSNSTRFQDRKHGGRPNNWISLFGGDTAWRWSPIRKEFYLHQFLPEQPDLNLRDPNVREEFKEIARFWLRKGVDGLRVDAVLHFLEDIKMRDEPQDPNWDLHWNPYDRLLHVFTRSLKESASVVKDWRLVADEPEFGGNRIIITEAYDPIPSLLDYYGPNQNDKYADMPFNFELIPLTHRQLHPRIVRQTIMNWLNSTEKMGWKKEKGAPMPWTCWVTGNHDNMRLSNRFGSQNVDAIIWMAFLLPGTPVVYYGDEIALNDLNFHDIPKSTVDEGEPTRLIFRSPMAWDDSLPHGGFSNASNLWLPMNHNFQENNVKRQLEKPGKTNLKNFIRMSKLRKEYLHTLMFGDYTFYTNQPESSKVFSLARLSERSHSLMLLINFDDHYRSKVNLEPAELDSVRSFSVPRRGKVLMISTDGGNLKEGEIVEIHEIELEPNQAAVLLLE